MEVNLIKSKNYKINKKRKFRKKIKNLILICINVKYVVKISIIF